MKKRNRRNDLKSVLRNIYEKKSTRRAWKSVVHEKKEKRTTRSQKHRPLAHSRKRSVKPRYDNAFPREGNRSPFHLARSRLHGCCSRSLWRWAGWWRDSNLRCLDAPRDKLVAVAGRKSAATSAPSPAVASVGSGPATTAYFSLSILSYRWDERLKLYLLNFF